MPCILTSTILFRVVKGLEYTFGSMTPRVYSVYRQDPAFYIFFFILIASFREQLTSYMHQLDTPEYMRWVSDAIEKEKMKQKHLQGVVTHLESEVTNLALETVGHMKESMLHVSCVTNTVA